MKHACKIAIPTALLIASLSGEAASPEFLPRECTAQVAGARCGVVYVPENHARPRGRQIGLSVVVLPATGKVQDPKRAQYDLEGGPGFAVGAFLEFYAGEGAPYRASRDVVLADMRGTGKSNPLRCFNLEDRERLQPGLPMYPPELVAECAQQSSVASDPAQYNTAAASRDIDLVRRALGYEKLDLNAVSYGTTLALRYIADFPARVHAAALMGTVPASKTPPRYHAQSADRAFTALAADCRADADCLAQFGDPEKQLDAALKRIATIPTLAPPEFLERVRARLYSPATRAGLPAWLAQAAAGDFRAFTAPSAGAGKFADGLYLSITCQESLARIDIDAAIESARGTRFGAYRLERQRDACAQWPQGIRDADLLRESASKVPVLFLTGALDPVTPTEWTDEAAARFSHSAVVRVARGAHVFDGLSGLDTCLDAAIIRFFDKADTALDVSCFAAMTPPPFGAAP